MQLKKLMFVVVILLVAAIVGVGCQPVSDSSQLSSETTSPSASPLKALSEFVASRRPLAIFVSQVEAKEVNQRFLLDKHGGKLYINLGESDGISQCDQVCQEKWAPMVFPWEEPVLTVPENFEAISTTQLENGLHHATYQGYPLYWLKPDAEVDEADLKAGGWQLAVFEN